MDTYKNFGKNTILFFIGNFVSKLIVFILLPFYTSLLTTEEYGQIEIINGYIGLILPISSLLMTEAIFRMCINKNRKEQMEYFSSYLFIGNTSILFFCLIYYILSDIITIGARINNIYIFLLLISLFNYEYIRIFLKVIDRISAYSITGILYSLFFVLLNIYLVGKKQVIGYVNSMIIVNIIFFLLILVKYKLYIFFSLKKIHIKIIKEGLYYVIPLIPTSIIWWIINLSDRLILERKGSYSLVGLYGVANKFALIIAIIFNIIYSSWQISAIKIEDSEEYTEFYKNIFKIVEVSLTLLAFISIICLQFFYKYFIGIDYLEALNYIPILIFGTIFCSFASFIGVNYIVLKKTKYAFYTGILAAISNICLNFILIPKLKLLGASIATLTSYILFFVIRKYNLDNIIKLQISKQYIFFYILFCICNIYFYYNTNFIKIILSLISLLLYLKLNISFIIKLYSFLNRYIQKILKYLKGD